VNFADDLLDQVFHGDEAQDATELIHDHGHANTARAHLDKQFGGGFAFGNDEQFVESIAKIEGQDGRALRGAAFAIEQHPQHVLDVGEAANIIERGLIDGQTRALRGDEESERFVQCGVHRERMHVRARHHDFGAPSSGRFPLRRE